MVYVDDTNTPNYLCKKGQFCDIAEKANAGVENDCPVGFFMPHYGATAESDCIQCPPGYQCFNTATVAPVECDAGSHCPVQTEDYDTNGCTGATCRTECLAGYYCPQGTIVDDDAVTQTYGARDQYSCGFGRYQPDPAQDHCERCPSGEFCDLEATTSSTPCTSGYWCNHFQLTSEDQTSAFGAATEFHCEQGFHTKSAGKTFQDCEIYGDVSYYIKNSGETGQIAHGYKSGDLADYQSLADPSKAYGEWDEIPTLGGAVCTFGNYCLLGIQYECPPGKYCQEGKMDFDPTDTGNTDITVTDYDCDFGYYCEGQSRSRRP
jgi:hypothetical protein